MEYKDTKLVKELTKDIEGKKVLILGFGREGKANLMAVRAAGGFASLTIADAREITREELGNEAGDIRLICGSDYEKAMDEADYVLKSPGVVLDRDFSDYSCKITSESELFLKVYGSQTIGITGTKGKSTTTTLIYHILKTCGRKAVLLGNIGIPAFERLTEIEEDSIVVFELSCHQLEHNHCSPHWALYLNLYPEHLDHYGTFDKYKEAKENIYANQGMDDFLYCGEEVYPEAGRCRSGVTEVFYDDLIDINEDEIPLKGEHNRFNITIAASVLMDMALSEEEIKEAVKSYTPLAHRLEYCGTYDGIRFYDDSISTIPEACIAAIQTVKDVDTVLIGGMDRGIDYLSLIDFLAKDKIPNIILMEATGKRIHVEMKDRAAELYNSDRVILVDHLEDAVKEGKKRTREGHALVMSPAAASYGIFKNFEERGDVFKELIKG